MPQEAKGTEKKITATFIVITKPYPAPGSDHKGWNPNQKLSVAAKEAIKETGQTGELSGWILTFNGATLNFDSTFEQAGIKDGDKLHLNPKRGTGGTRA